MPRMPFTAFLTDFRTNPVFRRLFKNTGLLLSGDTVSAILGVLTFAVSARALGTEVLGMLVLIDAYVRIIDRLVNFQSWQFMIKYGSEALERADASGFKALIKFGVLVDGTTALAGCLIAVLLVPLIAAWQSWTPEMTDLARLYSLIIAFNIAGVPTGILRIFDRFQLFSVQKSFCASIKFLGAAGAWAAGAGLKGFVWAWMVTEIFDYLSLTFMAWRELKRRGYHGIWKEPLRGIRVRYPGLWRFLTSTNLTGSVKVGFREFDILIVGWLLTLTDVSLYKLAKKLCASLDRLTNPLYQSLYPELAKSWARREIENFKKIVRHMVFLMGGLSLAVWVLFLVMGRPVIEVMAGREFLDAYFMTVIFLLGNGVAITTLPLAPMILAMGRAGLGFMIQFIPVLIYFPVLYAMILAWGLAGAGYAFLVYQALRVFLQALFFEGILRKEIKSQASQA